MATSVSVVVWPTAGISEIGGVVFLSTWSVHQVYPSIRLRFFFEGQRLADRSDAGRDTCLFGDNAEFC